MYEVVHNAALVPVASQNFDLLKVLVELLREESWAKPETVEKSRKKRILFFIVASESFQWIRLCVKIVEVEEREGRSEH